MQMGVGKPDVYWQQDGSLSHWCEIVKFEDFKIGWNLRDSTILWPRFLTLHSSCYFICHNKMGKQGVRKEGLRNPGTYIR